MSMPEKWKLFFKLFCFVKPQNVPTDSIEAAFMFEQVTLAQTTHIALACSLHVDDFLF